MRRIWVYLLLVLVAACTGDSGGGSILGGASQPAAGYEIYTENGGVARPANAIDVYIVYSPESQQYMPELIRRFNQAYADGNNPLTGNRMGADERPIYVWGTDPVTGSSGTVAQGVTNALIAENNDNIYRPTIFQPSVSTWLGLVNSNTNREVFDLAAIQPTALTPVIIGIWEERLNQLIELTGKPREQIGWADILTVLENGWSEGRQAVYYGHTDPRISSTGLSNTVIEFYACARQNGFTGRRLTTTEVRDPAVQECMRGIQQLVRHYSRRTEDFLEYFGQGPEYLDMLALEETDLICINTGAQQGDEQCLQPQEGRLMALYPAEGTFWHEHPFGIVQLDVSDGGWTTAEQREGARIFTDFVLLPDSQRHIMQFGFRPANPDVPVEYPFVEENGVLPQVPVPILDIPETSVLTAIQESWTLIKKPADILIIIDISGSMEEDNKLEQAKEAVDLFMSLMDPNNRVALMVFSDDVDLRVPLGNLESVDNAIHSNVQGLRADGGTELFYALQEGILYMNEDENEDRIRAVVVLSDGADTGDSGRTLNDALLAIEDSRTSLNPVIVVPIAYGSNADVGTLNSIARASQTRVQDGSDPSEIQGLLELIGSFF